MSRVHTSPGGGAAKAAYILTAAAAAFSGFAQMPITKRYYIADIPGMAWSADFFVTSNVHYIAAALLMAMLAWRLGLDARGAEANWSWGPRSWWGWLLFGALIITGAGKVLRNTGAFLPPNVMVALDFTHLFCAMAFLFTAIGALFVPRRTKARA